MLASEFSQFDKVPQVIDCMARLEGETSNQLFEVLEEWYSYLESAQIQIEEPAP